MNSASRIMASCFVVVVATIPTASAQRGGFGRGLPQSGTFMPKVDVYDDAGQVFSTAKLKGSYTVLVFGCLT